MYNFKPARKNIDIGTVHPFCLFGEEEYLKANPRHTNAQIASIEAEYYEISIKKLEDLLGPKIIDIFRMELKASLNKKILYRQSQYASTITLQNKSSMNYFYLQDGKEKESPRKFRITKMNAFLDYNKKDSQSPPSSPNKTALYTSQNFNKLIREEKNPHSDSNQK